MSNVNETRAALKKGVEGAPAGVVANNRDQLLAVLTDHERLVDENANLAAEVARLKQDLDAATS